MAYFRSHRRNANVAYWIGYCAIDTAQSYFNEEQVGAAIEKSGVDRKDIFLTTKVWIEHYGYEKPRLTDTQILSL